MVGLVDAENEYQIDEDKEDGKLQGIEEHGATISQERAAMNSKISARRVGLAAFTLLAAVVLREIFLRRGGEVFYLDQKKVNLNARERRGSYVILCLGEGDDCGVNELAFFD